MLDTQSIRRKGMKEIIRIDGETAFQTIDIRDCILGAVDDGCLDKCDLIIGLVKFLSVDQVKEFCGRNEIDLDWLAEWERHAEWEEEHRHRFIKCT